MYTVANGSNSKVVEQKPRGHRSLFNRLFSPTHKHSQSMPNFSPRYDLKPISPHLLNDPAFSQDPTSHPLHASSASRPSTAGGVSQGYPFPNSVEIPTTTPRRPPPPQVIPPDTFARDAFIDDGSDVDTFPLQPPNSPQVPDGPGPNQAAKSAGGAGYDIGFPFQPAVFRSGKWTVAEPVSASNSSESGPSVSSSTPQTSTSSHIRDAAVKPEPSMIVSPTPAPQVAVKITPPEKPEKRGRVLSFFSRKSAPSSSNSSSTRPDAPQTKLHKPRIPSLTSASKVDNVQTSPSDAIDRPKTTRNISAPELHDAERAELPPRPSTTLADQPAQSKSANGATQRRGQLDRIDELDETNPLGLHIHHGGPYEAINRLVSEQRGHTRDPAHAPKKRHAGSGGSKASSISVMSAVPMSLNIVPGQIIPRDFALGARAIINVPKHASQPIYPSHLYNIPMDRPPSEGNPPRHPDVSGQYPVKQESSRSSNSTPLRHQHHSQSLPPQPPAFSAAHRAPGEFSAGSHHLVEPPAPEFNPYAQYSSSAQPYAGRSAPDQRNTQEGPWSPSQDFVRSPGSSSGVIAAPIPHHFPQNTNHEPERLAPEPRPPVHGTPSPVYSHKDAYGGIDPPSEEYEASTSRGPSPHAPASREPSPMQGAADASSASTSVSSHHGQTWSSPAVAAQPADKLQAAHDEAVRITGHNPAPSFPPPVNVEQNTEALHITDHNPTPSLSPPVNVERYNDARSTITPSSKAPSMAPSRYRGPPPKTAHLPRRLVMPTPLQQSPPLPSATPGMSYGAGRSPHAQHQSGDYRNAIRFQSPAPHAAHPSHTPYPREHALRSPPPPGQSEHGFSSMQEHRNAYGGSNQSSFSRDQQTRYDMVVSPYDSPHNLPLLPILDPKLPPSKTSSYTTRAQVIPMSPDRKVLRKRSVLPAGGSAHISMTVIPDAKADKDKKGKKEKESAERDKERTKEAGKPPKRVLSKRRSEI
ncbi:hypothetical protein HGRIS_008143 [Hohenbuehelia grisea]|uniref:Uncharacterized protein n=1 Tax=Hohenbuehelia grisea TaxID=104357 RepID=A0ABR3J726_9AGAR